MRALAVVHQPDAGPGVFADAAGRQGWELQEWSIADGGPPPDALANFQAVMVFGGAVNADQEAAHPWMRDEKQLLAALLGRGMPILGVCLGAQLLAEAAGAPARRAPGPEIGWVEVQVSDAGASDPLIAALSPRVRAFEWHSYEFPLPEGAVALAYSPTCLQAFRLGEAAWGIQFHAEVTGADARHWIDEYRNDPDAVRIGLDALALRAATDRAIEDWNAVGRGLCERFLNVAASAQR
jgi:GMP synthase-like glutamine amidotransferase